MSKAHSHNTNTDLKEYVVIHLTKNVQDFHEGISREEILLQ